MYFVRHRASCFLSQDAASTLNGNQVAASASCKDKPALHLREAYSDKQFQAERRGQIAAERLEAELTDTFGASPSCEQEDLLKKLDYLMQTLTTMFKTAAPLIDLVSVPYTEAAKAILI